MHNFNFNTTNFTEYSALVVPKYNTTSEPQCMTFDFGNITFTSPDSVTEFTNGASPIECTEEKWIFDTAEFTSTATTEWGNVCARKQLNVFDTQSFMIGKLIGAILFGAISDAIGRLKTYTISLTLQPEIQNMR